MTTSWLVDVHGNVCATSRHGSARQFFAPVPLTEVTGCSASVWVGSEGPRKPHKRVWHLGRSS